jgi:putative drug exporter of the RND superfamily
MQRAQKNRKPYAIAMLVVIAWFIITGVFGPLFGKLTSVQENNNSSFLPKGAEATLAADEIKMFSTQASINFPALVLFEGTSLSCYLRGRSMNTSHKLVI